MNDEILEFEKLFMAVEALKDVITFIPMAILIKNHMLTTNIAASAAS